MGKIKAVFFDIDGTLVSFKTHRVPQSTLDAVHRIRQKGIKVFIATGRPRPFINNLGDLEYDGIMSVNGASIVLNDGTVITHNNVDKTDVKRMVEYQDKNPIAVAYATDTEAFVTHYNERFREVFELLDLGIPRTLPAEDALKMDIMQVIAFFGEEDESNIMNNVLTNCDAMRWHPFFADCIAKGTSKATGIDDVIRHFGFDISETMAFGDGGNDKEMLRHAGWGIAMGNASDEVKACARFVTDSVDDDGIAKVLDNIDEFNYTKWVSCWGNATSITDRKEAVFAKDITLRYPVRLVFDGSKLRFRFSNLTGTEPVKITKAFVAKTSGEYKPVPITFHGEMGEIINPEEEKTSDEIAFSAKAGDMVEVSMYFADYTQMNAGTLITGPLSKGKYSYGDFAEQKDLPMDLTRNTNWFYFLNTIDILTEEKNHALVCYGDSITAQSWPDYLAIRAWEGGHRDVAIIRRAVSGTRILRQYDCITYQAYGLKGATRFPIEMNVAGASAVIIQHGINDIIHPVGVEVNPFRPWSDMPTCEDLIKGTEDIYISHARKLGLKVWSGTLLPIYGWRTYTEGRDVLRKEFNEWLRTSDLFDGCIDFDKAVRDDSHPEAFADGFDSGDHLHPSEAAYEAMANAVPEELL